MACPRGRKLDKITQTYQTNKCQWYQKPTNFDDEKLNHAMVLYAAEDLRMEHRPLPRIGNFEVLVAMDTVGLNSFDINHVVHGKFGPFLIDKPTIIGQEGAGVVAQAGKGVKHVKEGDRVGIEPGLPCSYCQFCKAGYQNICPSIKFCVTEPYDGNLERFHKHAGDFCTKIPDYITMEEAALLAPLATAVATCRRAVLHENSSLIIIGAGSIGLLCLLTAQFIGVKDILVIDIKRDRLNVALELGATNTLLTTLDACPRELGRKIEESLGRRFDKTIDTVGSDTTTKLGVCATNTNGIIAIVNLAKENVKLPTIEAFSRNIDLFGAYRIRNDYKVAWEMLVSGNIKLKRLITHHFNMIDSKKAFDVLKNVDESHAIKVQIHLQPPDVNNPAPYSSNNDLYSTESSMNFESKDLYIKKIND